MNTQNTQDNMIDCPYCAEKINAKAIKCRHCGEMLSKTNHAPRQLDLATQQMQSIIINNNQKRGFGWGKHLIFTLLTGGLWLPIWLLCYLFRNRNIYY